MKYKSIYNNFISLIKKMSPMSSCDIRDKLGNMIIEEYGDRVFILKSKTTFSHYFTIRCGNIGSEELTIRISDHYQNSTEEIKNINVVIPKKSKMLVVSSERSQPLLLSIKEFMKFIETAVYLKDAANFKHGIDLNDNRLINDFRDPSTGIDLKPCIDYSKIPVFIDDSVGLTLEDVNNWSNFIKLYSEKVFDFNYQSMSGNEKTALCNIFTSAYSRIKCGIDLNFVQQIIAGRFSGYKNDEALVDVFIGIRSVVLEESKKQWKKYSKKIKKENNVIDGSITPQIQITDFYKGYDGSVPAESYNDYRWRLVYRVETINYISTIFPWINDSAAPHKNKINAIISSKHGGSLEKIISAFLSAYNKKSNNDINAIINYTYSMVTSPRGYDKLAPDIIKTYNDLIDFNKEDNVINNIEVDCMCEEPAHEQFIVTYEIVKDPISTNECLNNDEERASKAEEFKAILEKGIMRYNSLTNKQHEIIDNVFIEAPNIDYEYAIATINSGIHTTKTLQHTCYELIKEYKKEAAIN